MPNFNGETLTITLDIGTTEIDVKDLYSEWKRWLTTGGTQNRKYPQAFRTVGGDNLTPGITAGAYYFIQNQFGWRIKPAEEDATVLLTGNLAPENSSLPILVPTDGDYSVLVAGLQPITQSVEDILTQNQQIEYRGQVVVDFIFGRSGNIYPIGLTSDPVDNVLDAFTIANNIGSTTFVIKNGTFVLDRNAISYTFIQGGGEGTVDVNGYNVGGSNFLGTLFKNTDFSGTTSGVHVIGSNIFGMKNFRGFAENCGIVGEITLQPNACVFNKCFSINLTGDEEGEAIFNAQNHGAVLNITSFSGTMDLINTTSTFKGDVNITAGEIHIYDSCSGGTLNLRGIGDLTDNSTGIQINRNGFIEGEDVIQLREYIYIDVENGETGTTENVGTSIRPVNNLQDAYTISEKRKIKKFRIKTETQNTAIELDRDYLDYVFEGTIGKFNAFININGFNVNDSVFRNVSIFGGGSGDIFGERIDTLNVTGITGIIQDSGILGIVVNEDNHELELINCYSAVGGSGYPIVDFNGQSGVTFIVRNYSGSLGLKNSTHLNNSLSFDVTSGRMILDETNTAGDLIMRGVGSLLDNSMGLSINRTGFIEGDDLIQLRSYIYIDTVNGESGITENIGTIVRPVNNLQDAYTISQKRKQFAFKIKTDPFGVNRIILDRDYSNYIFEGIISPSTAIIDLNGQVVNGTAFKNVAISGSCIGNIIAKDTVVSDVSGFVGVFDDCSLTGIITPADYGETIMEDCFSITTNLTPNTPTINMGLITNRNVQLRNHGGNLDFINLTNPNAKLTLDINNGVITGDMSNTSGNVNIRGIGVLIDETNGSVVNSTSFINPQYIEELYKLQGLDPNTPMTVTKTSRIAGNINLAITGDGENTATVTRT